LSGVLDAGFWSERSGDPDERSESGVFPVF